MILYYRMASACKNVRVSSMRKMESVLPAVYSVKNAMNKAVYNAPPSLFSSLATISVSIHASLAFTKKTLFVQNATSDVQPAKTQPLVVLPAMPNFFSSQVLKNAYRSVLLDSSAPKTNVSLVLKTVANVALNLCVYNVSSHSDYKMANVLKHVLVNSTLFHQIIAYVSCANYIQPVTQVV